VDEAVGRFYENPDKYSHNALPSMSNKVNDAKDTKMQVHSPPPYTTPAIVKGVPRPLYHTNAVVEAGNTRALDEVRLIITIPV
jgi:hypothetical protein